MKKVLLSLIVLAAFSSVSAQENDGEAIVTCHQKYAKVFENRGAYPITDGVYDNVIITFRKGSMADCLYGKVKVQNEEINTYEMYLKFEDDSYEKIQRKFRYPEEKITIENGMSRTMITVDDELITILFVKSIKPKKKSYVKAADPDFDF
ncbi:MAG: hypothetical protein J5I47_03645 [Vicingus serpentipes]|nr:hypothetical protein [Vicingus serpentipes]